MRSPTEAGHPRHSVLSLRTLTPLLLCGVLLAIAPGAHANQSDRAKVKELPEKWQIWLTEEVYPLITDEQRDAFLALDTEAQRESFAERMWSVWGNQTGEGAAFRTIYADRLAFCRAEYDSTTEDRARVLLLHGRPDAIKEIRCPQVFHPMEFWIWEYLPGVGQGVVVLFYQAWGVGPHQLWNPFRGRRVLYTDAAASSAMRSTTGFIMDRVERRCIDGEIALRLLNSAEYWLRDLRVSQNMRRLMPRGDSATESTSARFLKFSTLVDEDAPPIDFDVTGSVRGRRGGKVRVGFDVRLPNEKLGTSTVGDKKIVQLDVIGEISRGTHMVDRFRYLFTLPSASEELALLLERYLRPGSYSLRLKVADEHSRRASVREIDFEAQPSATEDGAGVAAPTAVDEPEVHMASITLPTGTDSEELSRTFNIPLYDSEAVMSLRGPEGEGLTGLQTFEALVTPDVAKVEFYLDEQLVLAKNRPPFEVDLDLGPLPRLASVVAVAYDADGYELDRQQMDLNIGRERFLVRLQPFGPADRADGSIHAVASVNIPSEKELERLELFWNDQRLTTLYQEPYEAWLPIDQSEEVGFVRALAVLDDGSQAEDIQFVNLPQFLSEVEVQAVELPVTVLDRSSGKPVEGLTKEDFSVVEEGVPQEISYFNLQSDLPIRLGLVIDTSGSMEKTLPDVQKVVFGFLRDLLRPKDRAFVEAFSDRPVLLETFSADFNALENALLALNADRETALYDAVVFGLFQFSGVRGRKALIVLTDGEDNVSEMDFDQAMEYAQRSGVTIYTIGIDLPLSQLRTRTQLRKMARSTGGEVFFISGAKGLQRIYDQIDRELRTQYLVAYTSSSEDTSDRFRKVEVEVDRPGVEVRTISGYYPGS